MLGEEGAEKGRGVRGGARVTGRGAPWGWSGASSHRAVGSQGWESWLAHPSLQDTSSGLKLTEWQDGAGWPLTVTFILVNHSTA